MTRERADAAGRETPARAPQAEVAGGGDTAQRQQPGAATDTRVEGWLTYVAERVAALDRELAALNGAVTVHVPARSLGAIWEFQRGPACADAPIATGLSELRAAVTTPPARTERP